MHPINGLQVDEYTKERYEQMITDAQRELYADAVARQQGDKRLGWLRTLLTHWRLRSATSIHEGSSNEGLLKAAQKK